LPTRGGDENEADMTAHDGSSDLSRRHAMTAAMRLLASAGVGWAVAGAARAAAGKIEQKIAGYQDHPQDSHSCAICLHFTPPGSCKLVDGQISPNGWCKLFAPKG
jgi:hypothetical protein